MGGYRLQKDVTFEGSVVFKNLLQLITAVHYFKEGASSLYYDIKILQSAFHVYSFG